MKLSITKQGFTLIELSLVLVVIAGLMAVVLVGARKVSAQMRMTETVFAMQKFSTQFKDYLSQFNEKAIFGPSDPRLWSANVIAAGDVVPAELKLNGQTIYSPFGMVEDNLYSEIKLLTFNNNHNDRGVSGPYYGLYITQLNYNRCVDLITALAGTDILINQYGIIRVQVNNDLSGLAIANNDINVVGASRDPHSVPINKMVYTGGDYSCKKVASDGGTALNNILFAFRLR